MDVIYNIAFILVLVGAVNWGLVGFTKFDLVAALFAGGGKFGNISTISRIVYSLVGISAIYIGTQYFLQIM
ncbi:DUF378 domain-containing protein [Romboutsia sp.]|uniref:DUF378 domain-containing protein n=1 Tax=Romboutsia sp. TaxID=1965302 RepID=UPI002B6AFBF2|nr:DUF378 domain-containing protein [Romboutsia sp.]HSQ88298.1 DUF378 domain-containing protein [Romboutsia sp.]